jgi:hypothetical protein
MLAAVVLAALTRNVPLGATAFALMAMARHFPVLAIDLIAPTGGGRPETILAMTQKRRLLEMADIAGLLIVSGAVLWHYPIVG